MLQLQSCTVQWCLWSLCRYLSPLHLLLQLSFDLPSAHLFGFLCSTKELRKEISWIFFLKSFLKLQSLLLRKSVFQFSVGRAAAAREPPTTPHLCRRQDLFQYCPGWICPLEWRPLKKGRSENPQDAAHPFAEVAAHFWEQYSHVCSCYHSADELGLIEVIDSNRSNRSNSNRSWNLVDTEGRAFSCYLKTVEKGSPFFF